jgi:DNA polymerase-1
MPRIKSSKSKHDEVVDKLSNLAKAKGSSINTSSTVSTLTRNDLKLPDDSELVLLVDGSNMFYRSCAVPSLKLLTNSKGQRTGALYGTLRSIISEMRRWRPDRMFFIIDKSGSIRKKKLFPEYKANRGKGLKTASGAVTYTQEEREEFEARARQLSVLQDILPELGVHFMMFSGIEADDIISCMTDKFQNTLIVSTDTDFIQLHNGINKFVYNPLTQKLRCIEEYGVLGKPYAVLKSIIGDPTDNVRGLDRVGWKTVSKWCSTKCPQSLEELKQMVENDSCTLAMKIKENWSIIERNHKLISLEPEVIDLDPPTILTINAVRDSKLTPNAMNAVRILKQEDMSMQTISDVMMLLQNRR